ncbi:acetyl-CoA carboxylase biotin carboxyl carrier protein [Anaerosphaera multitolerans]|uniref:Biotin carboxyl carrier protein of acetyl-CoA carboxylase n=1 Tax=Anaerosphaera multitolerans TaxID=2487351 RepID=A0A437S714_9FIRM|nr:biotin/lipoyl-containing protein [Anaerosphaera multitolerans]RVU54840.1 acetyl-CoA carboxylase biotin carboxyl carrier protein subunit [Anaerosphaera multitolerans]
MEVREIIDIFTNSNLSSLKYKDNNFSLELEKNSSNLDKSTTRELETNIENKLEGKKEHNKNNNEGNSNFKLESPLVGIFYSSPSPESPRFVEIGDSVKKGDVLCIVEAMKMFNEVKSPVNGIIKNNGFEDGELIQYGDVIFEIEEI